MGEKKKQSLLHTPLLIRADVSPPPSPSIPPIFLSPSSSFPPFPSPSPLPAPTHHSLPTAAIVGGSVVGAVAAVAVTATVVSAVAAKFGLSCFLAPFLNILSSVGGKFIEPFKKLLSVFGSCLPCWNGRKDGSDKTGTSTKFFSVWSNYLPCRKLRKDGSDKAGDDVTKAKADPEIDFSAIDIEAVAKVEETDSATANSPLYDVVKAYGDRLETSTQSFLTTQIGEFAMTTQEYFESLYSATSNASNELKVLKSSAHTYLEEVAKLKASAEQMGRPDVALMLQEETIGLGADKIEKSIIAIEYAAEMKRQQKLQNEPFILDEEGRLLDKGSLTGGEADYHLEDASNRQYRQYRSDARVESGVSELREETGAITQNDSSVEQQYMSSMALVPTTASAGADDAIQPTAGTIVPVPTKAIPPVPTTTTAGPIVPMPTKAITPISAAAVAKKPRWQLTQREKRHKRPTNLGHVSFSCEMSAHRLHFFTACRSGGIYGSPPPTTHAGDDLKHYNNNNYVEMHELDLDSKANNGKDSDYYNNGKDSSDYNNSFGSQPNSYSVNNHVGLLTSSKAPIRHHYDVNVQHPQPIADSSSSHQILQPTKISTNESNSNTPLDYGNPFDGVL